MLMMLCTIMLVAGLHRTQCFGPVGIRHLAPLASGADSTGEALDGAATADVDVKAVRRLLTATLCAIEPDAAGDVVATRGHRDRGEGR